MSIPNFRNRRGELITPRRVPAAEASNDFEAVLQLAVLEGAVVITRHDKPRAVLVAFAEFESLVKDRLPAREDLATPFDALLTSLQSPRARKAMKAAFDATPAMLGRAAAKAMKKR